MAILPIAGSPLAMPTSLSNHANYRHRHRKLWSTSRAAVEVGLPEFFACSAARYRLLAMRSAANVGVSVTDGCSRNLETWRTNLTVRKTRVPSSGEWQILH